MKKFLTKVLKGIRKVLFQPRLKCVCCGDEMIDPPYPCICETCKKEIKPIKAPCEKCGDEVEKEGQYCLVCKTLGRSFDKNVSAVIYDGEIKNLIWKFKYDNAKYLAPHLASFLVDIFNSSGISVDAIICVPLCAKRRKSRGYNQSELLAKEFCKIFEIPILENVLIRIKDTDTQTELSFKERLENMKDAFKVTDKKPLKGKRILVIDDVFTTGATMNACATALKNAGTAKVFGLTVAHTEKKIKMEKENE